MIPPLCAEIRLNESGYTRGCCLDSGHEGDHMEISGATWEPPGQVLRRLSDRWGRTHRIVWTGRLWLATHHDPDSDWRTEVEPTPELLEASLRTHHGDPSGPAEPNTHRKDAANGHGHEGLAGGDRAGDHRRAVGGRARRLPAPAERDLL